PQRAGLETLYAALLISTRTLHGCSLLENAGAYSPEQPFSSINALPKVFLIPAESCIVKWNGYNASFLP
ncbi:MAG: hypothetical protein RPS47_15910, partial [Colwellia sp.]